MKLKEVKEKLKELETVVFQFPDGELVPSHFHVTEVGLFSKHFIDCGGTKRHEQIANFQLWSANDVDHRLAPDKFAKIIELGEAAFSYLADLGDLEVEVEYQSDTIGKYGLDFDGTNFLLTSKQTDCLAKDKCGINLEVVGNCCDPSSGCC